MANPSQTTRLDALVAQCRTFDAEYSVRLHLEEAVANLEPLPNQRLLVIQPRRAGGVLPEGSLDSFRDIIAATAEIKLVKGVEFRGVEFNETARAYLLAAFGDRSNMTRLSFNGGRNPRDGSAGMPAMLAAIAAEPLRSRVQRLKFQRVFMPFADIPEARRAFVVGLATILRSSSSLESISINAVLEVDDWQQITAALRINRTLSMLFTASLVFGREVLLSFVRVFEENHSIKLWDMYSDGIGTGYALEALGAALLDALPRMTGLNHIRCRNNEARYFPARVVSALCTAETPHYYAEMVHFIVRTRVLCQAGRAKPAGGKGDFIVWLCTRAPLWVVVQVCTLLRKRSYLLRFAP